MRTVLIAIALSGLVFPGLGQLYNKDTKKGIIIIAYLLCIIGVFVYVMGRAMIPHLPADPDQVSMQVVRDMMNALRAENPTPFSSYNLLLMVVWIYSSIDAGVVAHSRWKARDAQPTTDHAAPDR